MTFFDTSTCRCKTIYNVKEYRKEVEKMENQAVLYILYRIKAYLLSDEFDIAKRYLEIEIKNLKNITQNECKKYNSCHDWYCMKCKNINCSANKNKDFTNNLEEELKN